MEDSRTSPVIYVISTVIVLALAGAGAAVLFSNPFGGQVVSQDSDQMRLRELMAVDPSQVLYEERSRFETGSEPVSIAINSQDELVIGQSSEIRTYSSAGNRLPLTLNPEGRVREVAIAPDDRIFVSTGDRVHIYAPTGPLEDTWIMPDAESFACSMEFIGDTVYIADAAQRTIHVFSREGDFVDSFGDFIVPTQYLDLSQTPEGDLVAVNSGRHRIETFDEDGNLMAWWGQFSMREPEHFCGCCNPIHFRIMKDGSVLTSEKGISRIKKYTPGGELIGYVAGPGSFSDHDLDCISPAMCFSSGGNDLAIDSRGLVYALGLKDGLVRVFAPTPSP